jgi:hypothetical protein
MTHPVRTLLRISAAIRTYCRQTADYRDPAHNSSIRAYLRQHLSIRTWTSWQRLSATDQAAFVYNQDFLPTNSLSLEQFKVRLASAQKAGYGLFTFWPRAARTIGGEASSNGVHNN